MPLCTIVRLSGSSSNVPVIPFGADRSTSPVSDRCAPDTSANPPSPLFLPPLALIVPVMRVVSCESMATCPPAPFVAASAAIVAPCCTVTFVAVSADLTPGPPLARASVVPIATTPPPVWPDALILAVAATVTLPFDTTSIAPPLVPGALPGADNCPSTMIDPPIPFSAIVPV